MTWVVQDAPQADDGLRLAFHLKSGDYFGVLAAALGFVEERLRGCVESEHDPELQLVKRMHTDLVRLHKGYRIEKRDQ
ncbi:MAG: hypothetical protein AAB573_01600 [Patescibacteria group bacterium]